MYHKHGTINNETDFLEGGKKELAQNNTQHSTQLEKAKIEKLEKVIGLQTIEIQIFEKNLNLSR